MAIWGEIIQHDRMMTDKSIPVYILAGGGSRRFGRDKSRALIGGQPLICHAASAVEPLSASITIVADRTGRYDDLGYRTIADKNPGLGPVGGLEAALADLAAQENGDWLLLLSCDLYGIRKNWIELLLSHRQQAHHAIAFRGAYWHPMPAIYEVGLLPGLQTQITRNRLSMQELLASTGAQPLAMPEDWDSLVNINRPADLEGLKTP